MFRVEYAAGLSAPAREQIPQPTLRRGLCQQTSRIALLSVIGLAAVGASVLAPDEALAQCVVGTDVLCQVSTDTTNTKFAGAPGADRFYELTGGPLHTATITNGTTIGGHGLAFGATIAAAIDVVNEGLIRVDAGNAPTAGGTSALDLRAPGGLLTYSGGGDIVNAGIGAGLGVLMSGAGTIDLDIAGDVSAVTDSGIFVSHAGTGSTSLNVTGKVTGAGTDTGNSESGIRVESNGGVDLRIADTVTGASGLTIRGGFGGSGDISVIGKGEIVGLDGEGVFVDNFGAGDIRLDVSGPITANNGAGVLIRNVTDSGDINVTTGDVTVGDLFTGLAIFSISETGDVTATVDGEVIGGGQGVSAAINSAAATGDVSVTTKALIDSGRGIFAANLGSGSVTVDAAGPINASLGEGIVVRTSGGAITVTAGDINAVGGIDARQDDTGVGGGAITINANGTINGDTGAGILAHGNDAVNVTVAETVTGGAGLVVRGGQLGSGDISVTGAGGFVGLTGDAVSITNSGSGNVVFDVSGPINAHGGNGIVVGDTAVGGDISITTGDVTAVGRAVLAVSLSTTADVNITANGDLNAGSTGVLASILANDATGEIRVTTNGAVNAATGISATNRGFGGIEVTATDPIVSSTGPGIFAQTKGGAITVTAGDITAVGGIDARQDDLGVGGGAITINANGTITSDVEPGILVQGNDAVSVTVAETVTGGAGLVLRGGALGSGDISVTGAGGFIALNGNAATVNNRGSGNVLFDVSGPIIANGGAGVLVRNDTTGGDINVTTGDVSVTDPDLVFNVIDVVADSETGDVDVAANGALTGGHTGVLASIDSSAGTGDVRVTTAGAIDSQAGIVANNSGSGSVTVNAAGPINAASGTGILALANDGAVAVTAGDITAIGDGIIARQDGGGAGGAAITVNATGTINATGTVGGLDGIGIVAIGNDAVNVTLARKVTGESGLLISGGAGGAGDISVTGAGGIEGVGGDAIFIENLGSGDVLFDVSGPIVANGGAGVRVRNGAIGGNVNVTTGDVSVTGVEFNVIEVRSASETGDVVVTANGALTGGSAGVLAISSPATTATGDIRVTTAGAIDSQAGIIANNFGSGSVTVDATGPISAAAGTGIFAATVDGAIAVTAGDIAAAEDGIVARQQNGGAGGAAITINANGTVNGGIGLGILAIGNDAVNVTVAGNVTGRTGLLINGGLQGTGDISVTGGGGFTSENDHAATILNLGDGDVVFDVSGQIIATGGSGVFVRENAVGGDISVKTGAVTATNSAIDIVSGSASGDITVVANGILNANDSGVFAALQNSATGDITVTTSGEINAANGIDVRNLGSGAISVTATAPITADGGVGISAQSSGGDITVTAGNVTSDATGIFAGHAALGTGAITVHANGKIDSAEGSGILVSGNGAVTVTAADIVTGVTGLALQGGILGTGDISVTGAGGFVSLDGAAVEIFNRGTGSVLFNVSGPISATGGSGVVVRDNGAGGNIDITTGAVTTGSRHQGIVAITNADNADVTVTANGDLKAGATALIAGISQTTATGNVNVTTNGSITARDGIDAENFGSGSITVTAAGPIAVTNGRGISALGGSGDITIRAGDVSSVGGAGIGIARLIAGHDTDATMNLTAGNVSGTVGIDIDNGRGAVAITANGKLTGTIGEGLRVFGDGSVSAILSDTVTGASNGLFLLGGIGGSGDVSVTGAGAIVGQNGEGAAIQNRGGGSTTVNLSGDIRATNGRGLVVSANGPVDLTVADVSGESGIAASVDGAGRLTVTANGDVVGTEAFGILALSDDTGDIVVDAFNVTGATEGIATVNFGTGSGSTFIHARGTVEGGDLAIDASSAGTVGIFNDGVIRNRSGASADDAILAVGANINLTNAGILVGGVTLRGDDNRFLNQGSWNNIGGESVFIGRGDLLTNASGGLILAGSDADVLEQTLWRGLESFRNSGRINLSDGGGGDVVMTSADTVFANGSVLEIDLGGVNGSDAFATAGTLDIQEGSRLVVNVVEPLALNFRYVVAQADGGLTGRFELEDQFLTAFLGLRDIYTDTTAFIEIAQLRALAAAGVTPNQKATAAGADSLADDNAVRGALLRLPNDAAAIDAFDQLSGEVHPVARRAMADNSRLPRNAVLDRLADDGRTGSVWGRGFIEERVSDADLNAARAERDTGGALFGVDRMLGDRFTVGVAAGRFNTDLNINDRHSTGRIQTAQALAYVGGRVGHWGLRAGVGYAETSTHTERQIAFPGLSASPEARYDGSVLQGFVDAGYRIALQSGYLEPFASLTNIRAETDAFTETSGSAALSGEANTDELTISTLGLRFGTRQVGAFALRGSAGWQDTSGDLNPDGRHAFDGGSTFTVLGAAQSDRAAVVDLEAEWQLSPNMTMGVAYDGVLGTEGEDHAVSGSFRIAF